MFVTPPKLVWVASRLLQLIAAAVTILFGYLAIGSLIFVSDGYRLLGLEVGIVVVPFSFLIWRYSVRTLRSYRREEPKGLEHIHKFGWLSAALFCVVVLMLFPGAFPVHGNADVEARVVILIMAGLALLGVVCGLAAPVKDDSIRLSAAGATAPASPAPSASKAKQKTNRKC